MHYGFILKHIEEVSHLITSRPAGFRITLEQATDGSEYWQQLYNYPDVGLTFVYIDYNNAALGSVMGLIPHFSFYISKDRMAHSQWYYKLGLGLGYSTEIYDPKYNNKNNVISTRFTGGILLELGHQYKLSNRLASGFSIALTHFSNGALKKPNSGINVISANLGLRYRLDTDVVTYQSNKTQPFEKKPFGYSLIMSAGLHEAIKIGAGTHPFIVLSGSIDKQLSRKSKLGLVLEWFYSESIRREIKYDEGLNGDKPNSSRVGLAIGHEMMIGPFSIITQMGYYLYDPYGAFDDMYLRANLRRYLGHHFFSGVGVKSHAAKAEAVEFIVGYRIR